MEIKLDLNDKNWAKFTGYDEYIIDAVAVPRVGEIIDLGEDFEKDWGHPSTFIVIDVVWKQLNGVLTPKLECHRWFEGNRQHELESRGWVRGYDD